MISIGEITDKVREGYTISYDEALALINKHTAEELATVADELRKEYTGDYLDTCSIMNARSGRCQENCKWCSQSKFHSTDIDIYPLVGKTEALESARYNAAKGVRRFSLVTSGRTMNDREIAKACDIYKEIGNKVKINMCASMGLLTKQQLQDLYDSGVKRYHCNLETAPSFFPSLCTTHTTEDKIRTIKWAQEVGMEVCSGGIIGMGESVEQRVELAVALRDLGICSVPINILNPIKGTPLEGTPPLTDDEIIKTVAIFRIVNPKSHIRFAGGRNLIKHLEPRLLHSGVSASIVGDMLTTSGSDIETDKAMFINEGYKL